MGIYDRPYYRDEQSQTFSLGGQRSMVVNLILINVVIFFLDAFTRPAPGGRWLSSHMAVSSAVLSEPWNWWKLLTYGFAHASLQSQLSIFHVGFNSYLIYDLSIQAEDQLIRRPVQSINMVVITQVSGSSQGLGAYANLVFSIGIMRGAMHDIGFMSDHFHDIHLTAARPVDIAEIIAQ